MSAGTPHAASVVAEAVHAAYLARVATWVDAAALGDEADLLVHAEPLDLRRVAYLVDRLGVPPLALLADGDELGWPLLCGRVEFLGGRAPRFGWRPDDGTPAVVTILRDEAGGQDVVAIGLRDGAVGTLDGAAMLGGQDMAEDPVTVLAGALDWLRAGRRGVVLLDRGRCLPVLRGKRGIVVPSVEAGDELRRALTPRLPKLLVA